MSKDYGMERWLENVSKLEYPAELLLIDNSPNLSYVEKVKKYCKKYGARNYEIKHLDFDKKASVDMKIEYSQETIRQYVLAGNYDAWFSWECDQIIPTDALNNLVNIMVEGDYMMVVHDSKSRLDPEITNTNMGITLIRRDCLLKNYFLPERNGKISLNSKDFYNIHDPTVFKKRVLESGGNYSEVFGIIKPIYHLNG